VGKGGAAKVTELKASKATVEEGSARPGKGKRTRGQGTPMGQMNENMIVGERVGFLWGVFHIRV